MTRNLVRKFISLVLVALFLVGVAAACNGNYVEPSNGITWTFFGDTATRNDGACVVSGGYLTCNNGFNLPVTLDMSNCTLITTSLPWLTFQTLIGGQSTPKAHYAFLATTFYDYYIECGLGLGGNGDPSGLEAIECFIDLAQSKWWAKKAADPPDSNFTTVAQPVPFPFVFPKTEWPSKVAHRLNRVFGDEAELIGFAQAALTATQRAQGAQVAGNTFWYIHQSQAAAQFGELMTQKMEKYSPLAANFKTAYFAAGLPDIIVTQAEIKAFAATLPTLPVPIVNALLADGLTPNDIATLGLSLAAPSVAATLPTTDISVFAVRGQRAAVLLNEAPNVSPVAAIKTAITDPAIAASAQAILTATLNGVKAAIAEGEFSDACDGMTALGLETNILGVPLVQANAINVALTSTRAPLCPVEDED